jgi:protein ImuA
MPPASLSALPSAAALTQVWRVDELAAGEAVLPTGHAALNAWLPGGGWPLDGLVEVLQARPGQHVWQLLLPALAQGGQGGPVVLVGAPWVPFGPALAAQGLPPERLLCVQADAPAARLWAAEQALRCAEVAAVLAWLPQARADQLRRLHLAAQQRQRLLVVFRTPAAQHESSPARLRLLLEGTDALQVRILKRPDAAFPPAAATHAGPGVHRHALDRTAALARGRARGLGLAGACGSPRAWRRRGRSAGAGGVGASRPPVGRPRDRLLRRLLRPKPDAAALVPNMRQRLHG